jgi:hypothetical protein
LKKIYKILLLLIILAYLVDKGLRESCWVKHSSYLIENTLNIKIRADENVLGFQDIPINKTITLTNKVTKASVRVSYTSLELTIYFFLDSMSNQKVLRIVDPYTGKNIYDYTTLKLLSEKDCLTDEEYCGGYNDSSLTKMGKPYLVYDANGFHK